MSDQATQLAERITQYLRMGGLFNPENMEHIKVRDLLIDCRECLQSATSPTPIDPASLAKMPPEWWQSLARLALLCANPHTLYKNREPLYAELAPLLAQIPGLTPPPPSPSPEAAQAAKEEQ